MNQAPALFPLGRKVMTPGLGCFIVKKLGGPSMGAPITEEQAIYWAQAAQRYLSGLIERHASGDWGDLEDEDKIANHRSILEGSRILSAYMIDGEKVFIITEAENDDGKRAFTTVLLASEY